MFVHKPNEEFEFDIFGIVPKRGLKFVDGLITIRFVRVREKRAIFCDETCCWPSHHCGFPGSSVIGTLRSSKSFDLPSIMFLS